MPVILTKNWERRNSGHRLNTKTAMPVKSQRIAYSSRSLFFLISSKVIKSRIILSTPTMI
jgi:hypothetical protein